MISIALCALFGQGGTMPCTIEVGVVPSSLLLWFRRRPVRLHPFLGFLRFALDTCRALTTLDRLSEAVLLEVVVATIARGLLCSSQDDSMSLAELCGSAFSLLRCRICSRTLRLLATAGIFSLSAHRLVSPLLNSSLPFSPRSLQP